MPAPKEPGGVLPSVKVKDGLVSVRFNGVEVTMGSDAAVRLGNRIMNAGWEAAEADFVVPTRRRKKPPDES